MKKTLLLVSILALFPMWTMASFDKNLSYGMVGPDIYQLQDVLIERGHLNHNSTGYFGLLTLNAVKAFQSANGIPNTGYVGSMTRGALNNIVKNATAESLANEISETGTSTPTASSTLNVACPVGYNCTPVGQQEVIENPVLGTQEQTAGLTLTVLGAKCKGEHIVLPYVIDGKWRSAVIRVYSEGVEINGGIDARSAISPREAPPSHFVGEHAFASTNDLSTSTSSYNKYTDNPILFKKMSYDVKVYDGIGKVGTNIVTGNRETFYGNVIAQSSGEVLLPSKCE